MTFQDIVIVLLVIGLVATWVVGARMIRRMSVDLDEFARDRVEHDELQANVGRTLGQLQLAADNLADALATRTERLHELLAQADAEASTLGEAITVAASLTTQLAAEAASLRSLAAAAAGTHAGIAHPEDAHVAHDSHANGSTNGSSHPVDAAMWSAEPVPIAPVNEGPLPTVRPAMPIVDEEPVAAVPATAEEVRRLARDGVDVATIARRTNRGREEVRLLLRFAGTAGAADGRRSPDGSARQGTLTPGTFRRP